MNTPPVPAALLLGLILTITGCGGGGGGPTPRKVATQWRQAFEEGDFGTAWDLRDPQQRGGRADYVASSKKARALAPTTPDHEVIDIEATRTAKDETRKEDFVFVYLRVTKRDYGPNDEVVTLRRVDGAWRVAKWEP